MKKILVPVDFSEQSISAFRFALEIATNSSGQIGLLHIISLPVVHDSPLMPVEGFKQGLIEDMKQAAHLKFLKMIHDFNKTKLTIHTDVLISNHIHRTIEEYTRKQCFDLVVMGTRGATGIREVVIGSNTEKVVRSSPAPVIAIKNYRPGIKIRDIVFPNTLDTDGQEELIMRIKALQNFFAATLHIIWINTPSVYAPDDDIRARLKAFANRFMLKDYTINVFSYTNEEAGILEFTKQIDGDMIAMGTHGLKGLAHFISGSVAEDVVNHTHYPVWTYSARAHQAGH